MDKSRILAVAAALLAFTLAACTQTAEPPGTIQTPVPTEPSTTVPDPDPDVDAPILYWNDSSRTTGLGNGFTASACPVDAPLLCVLKHGEQVGYLEALAFPIESFPDLDPDAIRTPISRCSLTDSSTVWPLTGPLAAVPITCSSASIRSRSC